MGWNGKGKHPVLQKTAQEILQMNESVTERHAEDHVDSKEKKPQPEFPEQVTLMERQATEKQAQFVENLSESLSSRKS